MTTRRAAIRRALDVRGRGRRHLVPVVVLTLTATALVVVPTAVAQAGTDVVTNCASSGAGSLPYEVAHAGSGDTVTFALSPSCSTIDLTGTITIGVDLTVTGPGAGAVAVHGDGSSAVFDVGAVSATVSGLTITGGEGTLGGGVENNGTLALTGSTVTGNGAELGAGIYNGAGATLTLTGSTVTGNTASSAGGGIENDGTATVGTSTISGNTADYGGGIDSPSATLTVANSTVADNTGTDDGGGIYIFDDYDPSQPIAATITNSTVSGNSSAFGGGISDDQGPVALGATIVAGNPSGNDCFLELAPLTDLGYNLDDDGSCALGGTSLSDTPAGLSTAGLQPNGGPTDTIALVDSSAAVDHVASEALCPATDQRGEVRSTPCDIGAYDTDQADTQAPCGVGTVACTTTVDAPSQEVVITGSKLSSSTATITLTVGLETLPCTGFSYPGQVATLSDSGLKAGTTVQVTDTVHGLPSKKGVLVCYQPAGSPPPTPFFLSKCHGKQSAPCFKSIKEEGGSVVVTLLIPSTDPRFHVGGAAPSVTGISPASATPGKKLTISGYDLSEVTGVTIGRVTARISKTAPTKVTVIVPAGAHGVVTVTSLAGVAHSAAVFTAT